MSAAVVKPRVRVRAGTVAFPAEQRPQRPTARYLRGDRSGVLHMRQAITRDAKWDVREAADRAAALAIDFMHNSGWIAGAADQIIVDTVGEELKLNARPDLAPLGYDDAERAVWCREVEAAWRRWAWNSAECDLAGKATFAEMLDGVVRHYIAYGEAFGVLDYMTARQRRQYGLETGTKVTIVAPHRLPRISREFEGFEDGIFHDAWGRATTYRFRERIGGIETDKDIAARDVIHVMDRGENPGAYRGVSVLAPVLKVIAQYDQAADATLAALLLQQVFAATIVSPEPSEDAFQALQTIEDTDPPPGYSADEWAGFVGGLRADLLEVWGQRLASLKEHGVAMNNPARIAHLGPGEELKMMTASTPGPQYLPLTQDLKREIARRLGVTFESLGMDHSNATYSSVRMGISSIWPIVLRRRLRIASPFADRIYAAWLEEMIASGRIGLKGGYQAFLANRSRVTYAEWQGPARPVADDYKAAMAAKVRLELGISSLADECAEYGRDWEENAAQIEREMKVLAENNIPSPFGKSQGGAGPNGAAADGNREPAKEDV